MPHNDKEILWLAADPIFKKKKKKKKKKNRWVNQLVGENGRTPRKNTWDTRKQNLACLTRQR